MLLNLTNYFASPPAASVFGRALSYTGETCDAETLTLCRNVPSPFRQVLASWCQAEPQVPGLSPAVPELPTCGPFHRTAWHLWDTEGSGSQVSLPRGGNTLLAREEKPKGRGWGWKYRSSDPHSTFPSARRAGFPLCKGLCGQLAPQLPPRDRKSRTGRYWCKRKLWKNSLPREGGQGWTFPRALLTWLLRELAAWLPTKQLPWEPGALAACHRAAAARGRPSPGSLAAAEELLFPERKIEIPGEKKTKKHWDFAEGTLSGRESR